MSKQTVDALVKRGIPQKLAETIAKAHTFKDLKVLSDDDIIAEYGEQAPVIFSAIGREPAKPVGKKPEKKAAKAKAKKTSKKKTPAEDTKKKATKAKKPAAATNYHALYRSLGA